MTFFGHALRLAAWLLLTGFAWEGRIAHVAAALESDDVSERVAAAKELGELRARPAIAVVLRALADPAPEVREAAAESAGRLRAEAAVPVLASWLTSSDARARAAAVDAIARIGHPSGEPALVRALLDPSAAVRVAVLDGVDARGDLVGPVATALDDADSSVRAAAARSLGRGGDGQGLFALVGKLSDDVPRVRLALVRALTDLADGDAVPSLLALADDPEPAVRAAAIYAVGALGGEAHVGALLRILEGGAIDAQRAALLALGEVGGPELAPVVARHLRHESLRAPAREASKRLAARTEEARLALGRAILDEADEAASLREAQDLGVALEELTADAPLPELAAPLGLAIEARSLPIESLLVTLGSSGANGALLPILLHLGRSAPERSAALLALEALFSRRGPDGRALEPIVDVLGSLTGDDERRALALLGAIAEERAAQHVLARLESSEPSTRVAAARALGSFEGDRAEAALFALLSDTDGEVRAVAAEGIGSRSRPARVAELVARLERSEPTDRLSVLQALGGLVARGDLEAIDRETRSDVIAALEARVFGARDDLASAALDVLARDRSGATLASIVEASARSDAALRAQAHRALAGIPGEKARFAARALLSAEREPLARAALFSALSILGDGADAPVAIEAVEHEPGHAGRAASHTLHELARRGELGEKIATELCRLARARDPIVRANLILAAARVGSPCPHTSALGARAEGELVRRAAALALDGALASERDALEVTAFDASGRVPLAGRPVVLLFADGSALVTRTDPRARVRLPDAARGALRLVSPSILRLEP